MPVINWGLATAVIPAYNEEDHIEDLLTVLRNVPQPRQIIVVDDASTDETAGVVLACSTIDNRVQLVRLEQNHGKGGS